MRRTTVLLLATVLTAGLVSACGGNTAGSDGLPTVSGKFGDKPKVKVDKSVPAGKQIESTILSKGDGPKVTKGDLLVADYLGSIYKSGKVFDNSYDRKVPAAFPIGVGKVVKGWDKTLVGVPAGSRVLMVLPPKFGYGKGGNSQAGIKGTDSLVFVVDVIASYGAKAAGAAPTPVSGLSKDLPQVTGDWGSEPTVKVAAGTTPPKSDPVITVLDKGAGDKVVKAHLLVLQYTAVDWTNKPLGKTWGAGGPQGVPVAAPGEQPGSNPFDLLIGTPVGSRVLMTLPSQAGTDASKQSVAVVIDILGQNGNAKEERAS